MTFRDIQRYEDSFGGDDFGNSVTKVHQPKSIDMNCQKYKINTFSWTIFKHVVTGDIKDHLM